MDLSAMVKAYRGSGSASYHPAMLLGLLIYGYATKVFSSRAIERATYDSVAFRFIIAGNEYPDHDTIATFRNAIVASGFLSLGGDLVENGNARRRQRNADLFEVENRLADADNALSFILDRQVDRHGRRVGALIVIEPRPAAQEFPGFPAERIRAVGDFACS